MHRSTTFELGLPYVARGAAICEGLRPTSDGPCATQEPLWTVKEPPKTTQARQRWLQQGSHRPLLGGPWGLENYVKRSVLHGFYKVSWTGASEPPQGAQEAPRSQSRDTQAVPTEAQKSPSKAVFKRASDPVFKRTSKSVCKSSSRPPQARCAEAIVHLTIGLA